jgi:hypothetical protein
MFARTQGGVLHRFFKSGRLRGVSAKNALFFLHRGSPKRAKPSFGGSRSFFFWGYLLKRKSVYQILIAKGFSRFSLPM